MSIYGRFDYLDVLSRASLLAPRDDEEDQAAANQAAAEEDEDEDEDYLLVLDDAAASTTVAEESFDENTTLPSEIHLSSDENSGSSNTDRGLTIVASLPSQEAAAWQLQQQQLQALSMQAYGRTTRNAYSTISLSTTESQYVQEDDTPSSVSSLSLSMASLPSSGFSENDWISEHEAEEESSAESSQSTGSSSSSSDDESTLVKGVVEQDVKSSSAGFLSNWSLRKAKEPWYARLETEQDWEAFRAECLTVMEAMGDEAPKNVDEMLAQLIAQEENMLYKKKESTFFGLSYETMAMIAGAAIVPLVSYALLSRNRREKVH